MEVSDVKKGTKEIVVNGARYADVACPFHGGIAVIETDDDGIDHYSKNVGYDPTCLTCFQTARLTVDHINAVTAHDDTTREEFGFAIREGDEQEAKLRERLGM